MSHSNSLLTMFCLTFAFASVQIASADTMSVTFNGNAAGNHGFYSGTGIPDGGFTTVTTLVNGTDGVALSLRERQRFAVPTLPQLDNVYNCSVGQQCSFDFSIETLGSRKLSDYNFHLSIADITKGTNIGFDPLLIFDNSYWQGSEVMVKNLPLQTGAQNSEFLGFGFLGLNWESSDTVLVQLLANGQGAEIGINSRALSPVVTPEPSAIILLGTIGLALFVGVRRKVRSSEV